MNGLPSKAMPVNESGKVRISPCKNNGRHSSEAYSEKNLNGMMLPPMNGGHDKAHRLFFPVPNAALPPFPSMVSFPNPGTGQRKLQSPAEANRELVDQLHAILSTSSASSKLPVTKSNESRMQALDSEKKDASKKPKSSSRNSPLPPLRTPPPSKKPSKPPKTVPIAPQGSRPAPQLHILPPFLNAAPAYFLNPVLHPQMNMMTSPLAQNIIPIPSSVVFPNGLTPPPQQRVISPMPKNLVNIAPKPLPTGPPPLTKKRKDDGSSREKSAGQVNRNTPQPTVIPAPVSGPANEDLDLLLSCVQSKISEDFGGPSGADSTSFRLSPPPLSPPKIRKSAPVDPKVLAARLKKLRKLLKPLDIALEESISNLTEDLAKISIKDKAASAQTTSGTSTPALRTSGTEDSSRILPFKKRHYKSVPSPKDLAEAGGKLPTTGDN